MNELRKLIADASHSLSTYKFPDVTIAQSRLDAILKAADIGGIANDRLDSVEIDDGYVCIETSWAVRGCSNSSSYRFPESILDAKNPLKAAAKWGLEKKITDATDRLNVAKRDAQYQEDQLKELNTKLAAANHDH